MRLVPHEGEAARQDAAIAHRAEQLPGGEKLGPFALQAFAIGARHAGRKPLDRLGPLAAPPRDKRRLASERPPGGVRRPPQPVDQERPHPPQAPGESPQAFALSGEMGARRMAGETAGQSRRPERTLVDARPHPRGHRLRRAVEALARLRDDRLPARQRAGERPKVGAKALAVAPDRAAAARVELRDCGEEVGAHRHGEFSRRGRRRRAPVRRMVDEGPVGLVADGGDDGDCAAGGGAHHRLVVEAHQVFERAAAASHDQNVRPRRGPIRGERVEAVDGRCDLGRGGLSLHPHRPDDDPDREAVGEPVEDVANDGAGRRRHHADDPRQERDCALARGVEQAFLGKLLAPRLEQRHQRPDAGKLERVDHDLVARFARKSGQFPGRDDFEPFLGLELEPLEGAAPDDGVEARVGVLEAEIGVSRAVRPAIAGNLAPDAHVAEAVLDGALERARQFANGDLGRVRSARVRLGHRPTMPHPGG